MLARAAVTGYVLERKYYIIVESTCLAGEVCRLWLVNVHVRRSQSAKKKKDLVSSDCYIVGRVFIHVPPK